MVPGELLISGIGLARGYLGRGSVTAERFIPNGLLRIIGGGVGSSSVGSSSGSNDGSSGSSSNGGGNGGEVLFGKNVSDYTRVYKTGDLCRYLVDGNLEYLGRIDHQVKVRGFRIELGEIEAVLNQHPLIRECIVIAREREEQAGGGGGGGDLRLVAYIIVTTTQQQQQDDDNNDDSSSVVEWQSEEGVSTSTSALRQFVKEKLPEYMIPSAFVRLLRLPLTPNGKVDRKALPAPDQTRPELEGVDYVAPSTPIEEQLVEIWKQLLGLERVGIHDNFFELGGHSLLATQLVSRLRAADKEGVEIPLRIVFESPTIAGIADFIEREEQQRLRGGATTQQETTALLLTSSSSTSSTSTTTRSSSKWLVGILPVDRSSEKNVMMGVLPLSFAQKRLWFLDQFEPGSSTYNIPSAVAIEGIFNVEALEESFVEIIKRHEVLRSIFVSPTQQQQQQQYNSSGRRTTIGDQRIGSVHAFIDRSSTMCGWCCCWW